MYTLDYNKRDAQGTVHTYPGPMFPDLAAAQSYAEKTLFDAEFVVVRNDAGQDVWNCYPTMTRG